MWNAATAPEDGPREAAETEFRRSRYAAISALRDGIERTLSGKVTEREQRIRSRLVERHYQRTHLPSIARIASGEEEPIPAAAAAWLGNAEFLFFMGIVVPCLLEYQVMPFTLYHRATRGYFASQEKLLRLDPQIAADRRIADVMFCMQRTNAEGLELLRQAMVTRNAKPLNLTGMKYLIGGWLMGLSAELDKVANGEVFFEVIERKVPPQHRAEVLRWVKSARAKAARHRIQ